LNKFVFLLLPALLILNHCGAPYQMTPRGQSIKEKLPEIQNVKMVPLLAGTAYETPAFFFESDQPQPAILILGGTHGNEPAGYEAALRLVDRFSKSPLKQGKVIIIPLANRIAVEKYDRRIPVPKGVDREKGNLNRCYPGSPDGYPMEKLTRKACCIRGLRNTRCLSVPTIPGGAYMPTMMISPGYERFLPARSGQSTVINTSQSGSAPRMRKREASVTGKW